MIDASDSQYARMKRGEPYRVDEDMLRRMSLAGRLVEKASAGAGSGGALKTEVLARLFRSMGERCVVRAPFFCDFGSETALGSGVFLNVGCVLLDGGGLEIGNNVWVGPGVVFCTVEHPMVAKHRREGLCCSRPIVVGSDVWLGAGVIILPGVTIGKASVVGAGGVVSRSIPPGCVAKGVPARSRRLAARR